MPNLSDTPQPQPVTSDSDAYGSADELLHLCRARPAQAFAIVVALLLLARWLLVPWAEALEQQAGELSALAAQLINTLLGVAAIVVVALPFQLLVPAIKRRPKVLSYEYWLDLIYWHQVQMAQELTRSSDRSRAQQGRAGL